MRKNQSHGKFQNKGPPYSRSLRNLGAFFAQRFTALAVHAVLRLNAFAVWTSVLVVIHVPMLWWVLQ